MIRQFLTFLMLAFLLTTCGSSTQINGSWKEEGVQPSTYRNIAVLTLTSEEGRRKMVENEIAASLNKRDIKATPGYTVFPVGYLKNQPSREAMQKKLVDAGVDGLLTINLLDIKEETRYTPGTTYYDPFPRYPYYRGYYGYYRHWYPVVYEEGYYTESTNIFLESNFYNIESGELVWSAQSKTVDPGNLSNFANSYSSAIVKQLLRDKVLEK